MSGTGTPAIAYEAAPDSRELPLGGPRSPVLAGAPVESYEVLHRDAGGRSGIWQCTPGRFESARRGDTELMHFLSGEGIITSADGTVHEIRAGVVLIAPDGWSGTWDIRETVRKVYTIWNVPAAAPMGIPTTPAITTPAATGSPTTTTTGEPS